MKRLLGILVIAAAGIVAEHALVRAYCVWWSRNLPLDTSVYIDGLGRPLTMAHNGFVALISRWGLWAGPGWFVVDAFLFLAAVLIIYGAIRLGLYLLSNQHLSTTDQGKSADGEASAQR